MGVDELDEAQVLAQGVQQGRGPKLTELHGAQFRGLRREGGGGPLGPELCSYPLAGPQVHLLDDTRLAISPRRAHPVEIRSTSFPFGNETWHTEEGNRTDKKYQ